MNLTLQTATIAASLFAAMLLKAGSASPSASDTRKASDAWAASISAEQSSNYTEALKQTIAAIFSPSLSLRKLVTDLPLAVRAPSGMS